MDTLVLNDGLKIGKCVYTRLTVGTLDAGGAIDATIAGEKVRLGMDGEPVIVTSPTLVSTERLRRQVKQLESEDGQTAKGPIQLSELRSMSERDYRALVHFADKVDGLFIARESDKNWGREEAGAGENPDGTGD